MQGMFAMVNKIYGINISEEKNIEVWHPHARFFSIYDEQE